MHFYLNSNKVHLFYNSSLHAELFKRYTDVVCSKKGDIYDTVKTIKDMGFNTLAAEIVFNADTVQWYKAIAPVWQEEMIKACDELGVFVVLWVPEFDEFTDKDDYKQAIEKHTNFWENHPSIILYFNDFNKTYYPLQQHPAMINNFTYIPKQRAKARERILSSDTIITDCDNTRGIFHNASGNMTKLYTTMQYMSFGLPLQEREDYHISGLRLKKSIYEF